MIAIVNHQKNVQVAPSYACLIHDSKDNGFTYQPDSRYSVVWFKGFHYLFSTISPIKNNRIDFGNRSYGGGCVRKFVNTGIIDNEHEAFAYIYYPSTKDLYCVALNADEARFGGIVVQPNLYHPMVQKFVRHKNLMTKWRRLTPLIGKWALFFNQFYAEVAYRPENSGALAAAANFKAIASY